MGRWRKDQILTIKKKKEFEFVDSIKEVEEYYAQEKYGIAKDDIGLKELVQEGKFPIEKEICSLHKGYYYIIDIKPNTIEFKSQKSTVNIAYAVFRKDKSHTFGDKVFPINVNSLINGDARPIFTNDEFTDYSQLIGKVIHVTSVKEGNDENTTRQPVFTGINIITTKEELDKYNVPPTEEDINFDLQLALWEFEQEEQEAYQPQYDTLDYFDDDPTMYMDF